MKHFRLIILVVFFPILTFGQINSIYFKKSENKLEDSTRTNLDEFYNTYLFLNKPNVVLKGYADTTGSTEFNVVLSNKRVETAKDYLVKKGYPNDKIKIEGFGATNIKGDELWKNRRVDLFIDSSLTVYDLIPKLNKEEQTFILNNQKDTIIYGKERTKIKIPAKCFTTYDNKLAENVIVKLTEFYSISDILSTNLSTVDEKGQILLTNGMINIEAMTNQNVKCKINDTIPIKVGFLTSNATKDYNLYYGKKLNKIIKWNTKSPNNLPTTYCFVESRGEDNMSIFKMITTPLNESILFDRYLNTNIKFPLQAINDNICGTETVSYNIDSKGNIRNIAIVNSLHPSIDANLIQVLQNSPTFTPKYKKEKKALKHYYTITFAYCQEKCNRKGKDWEISKHISQIGMYRNTSLNKTEIADSNYRKYSTNDIAYLMLSSSTLGYLNCDKLMSIKSTKVSINISMIPSYNLDFKIILDKYNSIVLGNRNSTEFVFENLPQGDNATLIGIKYDNGKVYVAKKKFIVSQQSISEIEFKEVTVDQLKHELENH